VRHLFWLLLAVAPAFAQTYPEKAVTIVVNFSAGGPLDAVARIIAEKAAADFKQPVLVENKPDGYTLLLSLDTQLRSRRGPRRKARAGAR
jgi:tripartite-type tricarboxylate transporter receptor subunit TctC